VRASRSPAFDPVTGAYFDNCSDAGAFEGRGEDAPGSRRRVRAAATPSIAAWIAAQD
jgi:hypothetical protein